MQVREILFIYSSLDPAGTLLAKNIREYYKMEKISDSLYNYGDKYMLKVNLDITNTDNIENSISFKPKIIIFLSRHTSLAKRKTLSVHVSGNPGSSAEYGGKPRSLAPSHPLLMKSLLIKIRELADRYKAHEYSVTMEVTHHGPTEIKTPSLFIEVGSTIEEWKDPKAIKILYEALISAIDTPISGIPCIGFGGPHYAPIFTKYMIESEYAIGHIFSKYILNEIDRKIVREAMLKSLNAKKALLDWKGMKGDERRRIKDILEEIDIEIVKI